MLDTSALSRIRTLAHTPSAEDAIQERRHRSASRDFPFDEPSTRLSKQVTFSGLKFQPSGHGRIYSTEHSRQSGALACRLMEMKFAVPFPSPSTPLSQLGIEKKKQLFPATTLCFADNVHLLLYW